MQSFFELEIASFNEATPPEGTAIDDSGEESERQLHCLGALNAIFALLRSDSASGARILCKNSGMLLDVGLKWLERVANVTHTTQHVKSFIEQMMPVQKSVHDALSFVDSGVDSEARFNADASYDRVKNARLAQNALKEQLDNNDEQCALGVCKKAHAEITLHLDHLWDFSQLWNTSVIDAATESFKKLAIVPPPAGSKGDHWLDCYEGDLDDIHAIFDLCKETVFLRPTAPFVAGLQQAENVLQKVCTFETAIGRSSGGLLTSLNTFVQQGRATEQENIFFAQVKGLMDKPVRMKRYMKAFRADPSRCLPKVSPRVLQIIEAICGPA